MALDQLTLAVPTFWHSWFIEGFWCGYSFGSISLFLCLFGSFNPFLHSFGSVNTFLHLFKSLSFCVISFLWFWVQGGHLFEPIYWPFVGECVGTVFLTFTQTLVSYSSLAHPSTCKGKCFVTTQQSKAWAIKRLKGFMLAWWSSTLSTKMHTAKKTSSMLACLAGSV